VVKKVDFDYSAKEYYDATGSEYDYITRVQNYELWVPLYIDLIQQHARIDGRLLDLGCGTGKSAIGFADRGFAVTGVDISEAMLESARRKVEAGRVEFVGGDIRSLPDLGNFAIATAMGEAFGCLAGVDELRSAFASVANLLEPDGLLVLDLPTNGFLDRFAKRNVVDSTDDRVVVYHSRPRSPAGGPVESVMEDFVKVDDVSWRRSSTKLTFYYFAPHEVAEQLRGAGFELVATYGLYQGNLCDSVDEELHRKSIVVARKMHLESHFDDALALGTTGKEVQSDEEPGLG